MSKSESEIMDIIKKVLTLDIEKAGCKEFLDQAHHLEKLSVEAALQASFGGEEQLSAKPGERKFVHIFYPPLQLGLLERIRKFCVSFRNTTTLPSVLRSGSSFPVYTVNFHEATVLALLETVLYHRDVVENLEDAGPDLLDYCVRSITDILSREPDEEKKIQPREEQESQEKTADEQTLVREEINHQRRQIEESLAFRSLSILRYLTDHMEVVSLGVLARLGKNDLYQFVI